MVSVSAKKRVVRTFTESGKANVSEMCRALGLNRSTFYALSQQSPSSRALEKEIVSLSESKPRYGYRRITALLRREGHKINAKRVQLVRRKRGLQVRKKQRKIRRLPSGDPERLRASSPNEVWSWDFVHDQTEKGGHFRILSVVDEYTRRCVALKPRRSYRSENVIEVLAGLISEEGKPRWIRSDNGPEFIAYAIRDWLKEEAITTKYINPGSPWEQPYVESFHDKLRDEFLNRELFYNLREAEVLLAAWREEYNTERPHSSLGYQTPDQFALRSQPPLRATPSAPPETSEQPPSPTYITNNPPLDTTV